MSKRESIVIGRLVNEPEKHGNVVYFDLAHTVYQTGKEKCVLERIRTVGNQAGLALTYLHKGDLCCVEGRYDAEISSNAIIANRITFLSSNKREG